MWQRNRRYKKSKYSGEHLPRGGSPTKVQSACLSIHHPSIHASTDSPIVYLLKYYVIDSTTALLQLNTDPDARERVHKVAFTDSVHSMYKQGVTQETVDWLVKVIITCISNRP